MIYDFDPDDDDDELRGFEAEQRRRKAEFHSLAWDRAFVFATVAAVFVIGFLVVRRMLS